MSERASARPRASTDTMNMADSDASSSSSSSSSDDKDDDDDEAIIIAPRVDKEQVAPRVYNADSSSNNDDFASPASPNPITGTIGTAGTTVIGTACTTVINTSSVST